MQFLVQKNEANDINDLGISGVFEEDAFLVKIVKIIDGINANAMVA